MQSKDQMAIKCSDDNETFIASPANRSAQGTQTRHVLKRHNIPRSATSTRFRDESAVGQHAQPHAQPRACVPRVNLCRSSSPAGTRGLLLSLRLNGARWCARYRSGRGTRPGFCVALSAHSVAQVARVHRAVRPTAGSAGGAAAVPAQAGGTARSLEIGFRGSCTQPPSLPPRWPGMRCPRAR